MFKKTTRFLCLLICAVVCVVPVCAEEEPDYDKEGTLWAEFNKNPEKDLWRFKEDWLHTAISMERYARTLFGDGLKKISFDSYPIRPEDDLYLCYLEYEVSGQTFKITFAWRFCQGFMLELVGFDPGDMPELFSYVRRAGADFEDQTAPGENFRQAMESVGERPQGEGWKLPVHDLFSIVNAYLQERHLPYIPAPERAAQDYVIEWEDPQMEAILRVITGIEDRPIQSTDLDFITGIDIRREDSMYCYRVFIDDGRYWDIPFAPGEKNRVREALGLTSSPRTLKSLADVKHFANLTSLSVMDTGISDAEPLRGMVKLEKLTLLLRPETKDISMLGTLPNLKSLMMWGGELPNVTDISFLANLTELESIFLIVPQITSLMLNTEQIR